MASNTEQNIVIIQETDSTNNYASRQLAENEVKEGTVFLAHRQSTGRGQLNNRWESESGKNLTFSLVLKPAFLEISNQFMLSKVVTLGIYSVLKNIVDEVKIKWPNDIYAGNRKLGGILIENAIQSGCFKYSIIGIGLNINQEHFYSNAPNPVSLKQLTGENYDLMHLLEEILDGINFYYQLLKEGKSTEIDQQYRQNMFRLGEIHYFRTDDHQFSGTITGVNEIGQLMITDEKGISQSFHFKEVEYIL